MRFDLVQCGYDGLPVNDEIALSDTMRANCAMGAELHKRLGYTPPWVGYIAVADGQPVGGGAFVGAPQGGKVEIAYYTNADLQGLGHASRTAAALVALAREAAPSVTLMAMTLPEQNASGRILERLGFRRTGTAIDDEAGEVWKWELPPES